MKRYEEFNQMVKKTYETTRTVEEQAAGMVIATILEEHNIAVTDTGIDDYVLCFRAYLEWLNEKVQDV